MDGMWRLESFKHAVGSARGVHQIPMIFVFMRQQS